MFVSRHRENILPVSAHIGQCAEADQTEEHVFLYKALTSEFGLSWFETYVTENIRSALASSWSTELSALIPASSLVFSRAKPNGDGTQSISVWFPEIKIRVSFAVGENGICAIGT